MNKVLAYIFFLLVGCSSLSAQTFGGHRYGYMGIDTYNGNTVPADITLFVDGTNNINIPNWRLTAKITQQVPTDGRIFPADKIVLHPSFTQGVAHPAPVPSAAQIGFFPSVVLNTYEQDLVTQSGAPLLHNNQGQYYRWEFKFDWQVLGGAYLSELQAYKKYYFTIEFKFYDGNNKLLATVPLPHELQVNNLGNPPVQNSFSIALNGGVQNGTLTLQSRSDYDSGTSVTYNGGLSVKTNAAYQVLVNASPGTPHFVYGSNTIDLDVLNVQLTSATSGVTQLNPITLSTNAQILAKGNSTQNQNTFFDVRYSVNPQTKDKLFYAVKAAGGPTTYSTTLQYTILAQ